MFLTLLQWQDTEAISFLILPCLYLFGFLSSYFANTCSVFCHPTCQYLFCFLSSYLTSTCLVFYHPTLPVPVRFSVILPYQYLFGFLSSHPTCQHLFGFLSSYLPAQLVFCHPTCQCLFLSASPSLCSIMFT